mgnify:CR=1 FL=1
MLDIVDGRPYLVSYPTRCHALNKWGRPNPPYVIFRHDGERWQRIPLASLPPEIKKANLVIGSYPSTRNRVPESELKYGYIPAETVLRINEYMTRRSMKYRLWIRREPFTGKSSCPEMVFYKGAWVGPGDSIGKRMIDRMTKSNDGDTKAKTNEYQ